MMQLTENKYRTIRVYGPLRQFIKDNRKGVIKLCVNTPQEAIKALCTVLPGFETFMQTSKRRGLTFAIFNGKRNIDRDELNFSGVEEIKIVPVIIGSKKAGMFQTILGAVLVVAGALLWATPMGAPLVASGAGMVLGGVVQMLSPMQGGLARREDPDNKPS